MSTNEEILGRADVNDLEAILAITNDGRGRGDPRGEGQRRRHLHVGLREGRAPGPQQALREGQERRSGTARPTCRGTPTSTSRSSWPTRRVDPDADPVFVAATPARRPAAPTGARRSGTSFIIESQNWTLSQFMHGEQGALVCTAKIVETVPWIDAKYYASTQVMDEARHVEVFAKYLDTKLDGHYPINAHLGMLLDDIIDDSRWDMTYLGMQIMVEGLALAAFGFMHMLTEEPLLKQLLRYVMSDEARHVAFGVLSLKEYYDELTDAEMLERQEFAFEAAVRMRDRFLQQEVWERMGVDVRSMIKLQLEHEVNKNDDPFQQLLFSKIVPNCKKLGLLDRNDGWLRNEVRRDRRHPVRGLGRHRLGLRHPQPREPGRGRFCSSGRRGGVTCS